jgi:hypothetical protein
VIRWAAPARRAAPGLRHLAEAGVPAEAWLDGPEALPAGLDLPFVPWDAEALAAGLSAGDVLVADLDPEALPGLARLCLERLAHLVAPAFAPGLEALAPEARAAGVALVSGIGFDPGLGTLMAHWLVDDCRRSGALASHPQDTALSLLIHAGAFPADPGPFRQKFAAPPSDFLAALARPARLRRHFSALSVAHPWDALTRLAAPLAAPETFEALPLGDSLAMAEAFHLDPLWPVRNLARGALLPLGWAEAWANVLDAIASGAATGELAQRLWQEHPLGPTEPDRAVVVASLTAERAGRPVYSQSWALDARADLRGGARDRLDSGLAARAAEALLAREIPPGVHGAPADLRLVLRWLEAAQGLAQYARVVDHLRR